MNIQKAHLNDLEHIVNIIVDSSIGEIYFKNKNLSKIIGSAISSDDFHVLYDNEIVGFIWSKKDASFDKYPFLHLITVKSEMRGKGYGRALLDYFENQLYKDAEKLFLMVGDFNERAKKLYEELDYKEVGILPSFYCDSVNEYLMMKEKNR